MTKEIIIAKLEKLIRRWKNPESRSDDWHQGYEAGMVQAADDLETLIDNIVERDVPLSEAEQKIKELRV